MTIKSDSEKLQIGDLPELTANNSLEFRETVRANLQPGHTVVELDLSLTNFIDGEGVGALLSLHKSMRKRQGRLRIVQATTVVIQTLELTRIDQILDVFE